MKYNLDEKYYLREVKVSDAADIFEFAKLDTVTKYLTWNSHQNIDETIWVIENLYLTKHKDNLPNNYAIIDSTNNKVIGIIDFMIDRNDTNHIGLGYFLNPEYWGKGIMTKALNMILEIGFEELNLSEIYISHLKENIGSKNVILKNGFRFYKNEKSIISSKNIESELVKYVITKDEFKNDK